MTDQSHSTHHRLIIIGAGPAGYTANLYAIRANLKPLHFVGYQAGGQLMVTTDVDNYPGFAHGTQGPDLMQAMREQVENLGATLMDEEIESIDVHRRPFTCKTDMGDVYTCDAIIIATGAQAQWLGIESEAFFTGYGVSGCATCDGFFFKDKRVAVVGGGNTAVEEALYLTQHASHVTLIHRRDQLRADHMNQERLLKHPKIDVIWNHIVDEVLGETDPKNVTGLRIKHTQTQATQTLNLDGVFIAIGHKPMTSFLKGQIDLDKAGYIMTTPGTSKTSIAGVFAAGDVQDAVYRQAITAAGQGCMAALDAEKWLNHASFIKN